MELNVAYVMEIAVVSRMLSSFLNSVTGVLRNLISGLALGKVCLVHLCSALKTFC